MSNTGAAAILPLVLASVCFGCFVWGTVKHFVWKGRGGRGAWIVSAASLVAFVVFVAATLRRGPARWWPFGSVMVLAALLLWAWTLRSTRKTPPSLVFADDSPILLFRHGPYRWVRHPFYTAYMTFWAGTLFIDGSLASAFCSAVIGCIYTVAATYEEQKFLRSGLAEHYRDYAASTGMFFPQAQRKRQPARA